MRSMIFASIIFLIVFSSCRKKERTTTISGTVIDYGSKKPIEDAKLILKDGILTSGPFSSSNFSSGKEIIDLSDENGKFDLELTGEFSPCLFLGHNEYWPYEDGNGLSSSATCYAKGSINEDVVFEMKAKAWFDGVFFYKNKVDSAHFQELTANFTQGSADAKFMGQGYFETSTFGKGWIAIGNDYFRYKIRHKYDNLWYEKIDSVYIKKGEIYRDTIYN